MKIIIKKLHDSEQKGHFELYHKGKKRKNKVTTKAMGHALVSNTS